MTKKVKIDIQSMAFKGYGVGRHEGKVVFIPYSVKEDQAWVEILQEKKDYSIGRLNRLLESSTWRVTPSCPSFGQCGGCHWQHIDTSVQGEFKKGILKEVLERIGKVKEIPPIDLVSPLEVYGYRNRVQMKVKGGKTGYYQERSHDIITIYHCPISHPLVNQIIFILQKELPSLSWIKEVEINVSPEEGKGILILHPHSFHQGLEPVVKRLLRAYPILKGIAIVKKEGVLLLGDASLNFTFDIDYPGETIPLKLRTSPQSFFQVNLEQNQALIQTVLHYSEVKRNERVLDLYSGIGNLTLPLTIGAKEAWGIEENRGAVENARFNAEKNRIDNCDFFLGRVEDVLKQWAREAPDLMVLDPPRGGCQRVLDQMVKLRPQKIVYVSCDPATFARDLHLFSGKGFHLHRLTLIDMFPQTYHMEVVGLLMS